MGMSNKLFLVVNIQCLPFWICFCSGLHHKKKDCNIEATVQKFQTIIDKNTNSFFPPSVNIQPGESTLISKFGPNGGWGDTRDHALCFQLMQKTWPMEKQGIGVHVSIESMVAYLLIILHGLSYLE